MISSILQYDPVVIRSLKKSRVRVDILRYLAKIYPNSSYPNEIARKIKMDPSNVIGGLRGMGNRYNGSSSLVELGLVEVVMKFNYPHYRLTELGKKIADHFEEELKWS